MVSARSVMVVGMLAARCFIKDHNLGFVMVDFHTAAPTPFLVRINHVLELCG